MVFANKKKSRCNTPALLSIKISTENYFEIIILLFITPSLPIRFKLYTPSVKERISTKVLPCMVWWNISLPLISYKMHCITLTVSITKLPLLGFG